MRSFLENQVKRIVGRFGFELRPLAPCDLRGKIDHPIAAAYLMGLRPCLVEVPLSHCRGFNGFPFTPCHPFVRTVRAYTEGRVSTYEGSALEAYYNHFQPKHAGDLFALPGPISRLHEVPPFAFVWPWESISVYDRTHTRSGRMKAENKKRGAPLPISHGYSTYGPVSQQKGTIEFLALARLADSVRRSGYVRKDQLDDDIRVVPLIDKIGEVRYLLRWGQHRAAVLAALGFERIPVVIGPMRLVRADEVDYWPHVRDELFTRDQALLLFDRIFTGSPAPNAIPPTWLAEASCREISNSDL